MSNLLVKTKEVLKKYDIETFLPGEHKGDCLKPYVVVKQAGTMDVATVSSEYKMYDIMCYVPKKQYEYLEPFVHKVKMSMKELFPVMVYVPGSQVGSFYDESNKSFMVSFQYRNVRRVLNW